MKWLRNNRKKQSRAERLYDWQLSLVTGVIIILPHFIMALFDDVTPVRKAVFIGLWILIFGAFLYLRILVPYKPIKNVRLRRVNVKIDWQQIHRWFKQKHVRKVWGDPKERLDEVLQREAVGEEYIIQVEQNPDWHDVGYIRLQPGEPPMVVVGEKYAYHQGVADKAKALLG